MNAKHEAKTVRDIMETDIVTATTQDNIYEIALKMKQHDIGFVPVVDGGRLVGVVTDRDLVVRGYAEKHSGSAGTEQVMSKGTVVSVSPEMSADEAAKLMARHQVRRLPVVDNDRLVGVVAIGDFAVRSALEEDAGKALADISEKHRQSIGHN